MKNSRDRNLKIAEILRLAIEGLQIIPQSK